MGDIEMYQMSEYDGVDVEIKVQGLHDAKEYHIHMVTKQLFAIKKELSVRRSAEPYDIYFLQVPIQEELKFPCENSTLYEVWSPLRVQEKTSSEIKTSDQFKMGDLSGKYGTWDHMTTVNSIHNDSNLQIFGLNSLLGRSLVITQEKMNRRYAIF